MKLTWIQENGLSGPSKDRGMLGKWTIFYVSRDPEVSQDDPKPYRALCNLPEISTYQGWYATVDEAKAHCEREFKCWLEGAEANPE